MNLIIEADLINPPTMLGSFRDLTFFASQFHPNYEVLLYCEHDLVDLYYNFLKNYAGGLDFVNDFIFSKEDGVYITSLMTNRITPETLPKILTNIGFKLKSIYD